MKRLIAYALVALAVSISLLRAADEEPAIRPDPRPTDLTSGRRGTSDEPVIRSEPRARDFSAPKTAAGRSTLQVSNLTPEQAERIRAVRQRATDEIQAIRDRERAEIMLVLNEEQRAEYIKLENAQSAERERPRRAVTTSPSTTAPTTSVETP